jgi:hypothetical protein
VQLHHAVDECVVRRDSDVTQLDQPAVAARGRRAQRLRRRGVHRLIATHQGDGRVRVEPSDAIGLDPVLPRAR